ncbi:MULTISPECIES: carbohydrate ABC transporter permease [Robinsoniella]|uniref:carbohydrate ABC transporter permease n=1 Tax=Robinsoniella TaxID=588605 RepID=UPI000487186B|nr:carbohydrate ABC transporter permease [Robinsoniella sp. KNHs210]
MKKTGKKRALGFGRFFILAFFLALVVLPIYWMTITSFKTNGEIINMQNITYFPHTFTTENYTGLFEMFDYGSLLQNSVIVSVSSALVVTMLSILGGYSLARYKFKGKGAMVLFFLVTQMIPGILVIIPLYLIFSKIGLINTHVGLFIYYVIVNVPFCVVTMRSFFERIPVTLEEAARVDGCTKMKSLIKIVLPIMFPGIVSVFVFAFIGAWNELIAGTIFISTPDMWTIPVGLKSLIGKYSVQWGALMAGGVMALLPTAIMFAGMQKFIVEGMTAGAVKE